MKPLITFVQGVRESIQDGAENVLRVAFCTSMKTTGDLIGAIIGAGGEGEGTNREELLRIVNQSIEDFGDLER